MNKFISRVMVVLAILIGLATAAPANARTVCRRVAVRRRSVVWVHHHRRVVYRRVVVYRYVYVPQYVPVHRRYRSSHTTVIVPLGGLLGGGDRDRGWHGDRNRGWEGRDRDDGDRGEHRGNWDRGRGHRR